LKGHDLKEKSVEIRVRGVKEIMRFYHRIAKMEVCSENGEEIQREGGGEPKY